MKVWSVKNEQSGGDSCCSSHLIQGLLHNRLLAPPFDSLQTSIEQQVLRGGGRAGDWTTNRNIITS